MSPILIFLDKMVELWHSFLDSLATIGGNIMVLLIVWLLTGGGVVYLLHHPDVNGAARDLVASTFAGVNGALMYALTQGRRGVNVTRSADYQPPAPPKPPTEVRDEQPNP